MANETIFDTPGGDSTYYYDGSTLASGVFGVGWNDDTSHDVKGSVRFTSVNIPKNASISSADLHMYVGTRYGSENIYAKVQGVDEDNTSTGNPFGRPTTSALNTHNDSANQGHYFTIGCGNVIEEIVARSGWSSGNALCLIVNDNGTTRTSGNEYLTDYMPTVPNTYLHVRVNAEPNFKPTPLSITAPSIPSTSDFGIKISKPGVNVETANEADTFFTTRKQQFKVFKEAYYQSVTADVTAGYKTIAHNLGYIPFASVYVKSAVFGGGWKKLPVSKDFEDHPTYYIDDTNLYLHSALAGEEFYYYIYNDQLTT